MPDFLVGSGKTYATIQSALDAVIALGSLAGLGDHNIIVDENHTQASGSLNFTGLQAAADGQVIIQSASGFYYLQLDTGIAPTAYTILRDFECIPNVGYTAGSLVGMIDFLAGGGSHITKKIKNFKLSNPNALTGVSGTYGGDLADGIVQDFIGAFRYGVSEAFNAARLTVNNCYANIKAVTAVDCVSTNSVAVDRDFYQVTSMSYCASSDATAAGTGSIVNIDPSVEFVNAAAGDYTLASGSQLIAAGSTGNNIGWDQTEVNVDPVLDTPQSDVTIQEGQTGTINAGANFSDANVGDTLTFSISPALPTGFSFNTSTGVISYDGNQVAAVAVSYTVTADDGNGGTLPTDEFTITVTPPALSAGPASDTTPYPGDNITIPHSNAAGTLTSGEFATVSQDGSNIVVTAFDPYTKVYAGQTYPTINFNTSVNVPISDGETTVNVPISILNPAGTLHAEITSIPEGSAYENDIGATVGMFAYWFNIVGSPAIDPATGLYALGEGESAEYALYNGEWGTSAPVTGDAPDTTAPVITILGDNPATVTQGDTYTDAGATALDDTDGDITADVVVTNNVNTANLGAQTVVYDVVDAAGNAAQATRTVNVEPIAISENTENPVPASIYVRVGTPYEFSQHITNPSAATLNYAIASGSPALPAGVTLNATTGQLTTTTNAYVPTNAISIEATIA